MSAEIKRLVQPSGVERMSLRGIDGEVRVTGQPGGRIYVSMFGTNGMFTKRQALIFADMLEAAEIAGDQ